jgi:hypothetical protein
MADFLRELESELSGRAEIFEKALAEVLEQAAVAIPRKAIAELVAHLDRSENVPDHVARNVEIVARWLKT